MEQLLFTQDYYYNLILIFFISFILQLFYYQDKKIIIILNIFILLFAIYISYYIGNRDISIGPDTIRYEKAFIYYKNLDEFIVRKDFLYDLLSFVLSKFLDFQQFLIFCSIIYVIGALFGLKLIFKTNFYIPFFLFLISPYFVANGISAIRSGMAASFFIISLGVYYKTNNFKKSMIWMILSLLMHLSMIVPFVFFIVAKYFKYTKIIFIFWVLSIFLGALNINVINVVVSNLGLFEDRIGDYAENVGERNYWTNFAIFGFFPVIIAIYNVLILKYEDNFYKWLLNSYMLIHIPYIILLNSEYGLRLGYLAEFMMPILLVYPILINSKIKMKFINIKFLIVLFIVFMIKAYKILII